MVTGKLYGACLVFIGDVLPALQVHTGVNEILIKMNRDEFKSLMVPVFADLRFTWYTFLVLAYLLSGVRVLLNANRMEQAQPAKAAV
jgi:hypothetical protein